MMRKGIISAGSWLVDSVKIIEKYPAPGNLITIESVKVGLGGCAHNVLVDLAKMGTGFPLYAGGCVGADDNGKFVLREIERNEIDSRHMTVVADELTAYTDVMAEKGGHSRTYFHYRGANAELDVSRIGQMDTNARIFHLGYLLLLDKLDAPDTEYGVQAARALDLLRKKGYKTSVDVVSEESDRFPRIVLPCLPYIDYLIINEIEASQCTGIPIRMPEGSYNLEKVKEAGKYLLDRGVNEQVTIHFPEGGYTVRSGGDEAFVESSPVSPADIVSTVGAGDAFCARMLYAIHEGYPIRAALCLANASARFNLYDATCTGGAPSLEQIQQFMKDNFKYQ